MCVGTREDISTHKRRVCGHGRLNKYARGNMFVSAGGDVHTHSPLCFCMRRKSSYFPFFEKYVHASDGWSIHTSGGICVPSGYDE